ncbi:hypothetical protein AALG83_02825 [Christensenellaceae bacterium 44-20]
MESLEIKLIAVRDRICAWEMFDTQARQYFNGSARPFKNVASHDKLSESDYYSIPYTKKQLKTFEYIGKYAEYFEELFSAATVILPEEKYDHLVKATFGSESKVYQLYHEKAKEPAAPKFQPTLYIDFEAMNMRICGWYAELVCENETLVYEGIAKPFSDTKYVQRLWSRTYSDLLTYSIDELCEAKHVQNFERYFIEMFSKAKKIYTYGDTDALFVKKTFGAELYNFFKIKNIDACVKVAGRALSLDRACKLFGVSVEGDLHNPKYDVIKMKACLDMVNAL